MNGTAVEAAPNSGKNVRALLSADAAKARIFPMLPGRTPEDKQAEYDRLVTIIDRATRKEPKLLTCTGTSIIDAAATIVGWNLEIGDTAHLVPFADKATGTTTCVPMMDYKGMAQILVTSGVVRAVEPWCVYENDDFEVRGGTNAGIMHTPVWKGVRGKLIGAYVIFRLKNQYTTFKWMPIEDIDAIRQRFSKSWKGGACPPWYAMKTVIRQGRKVLSTTPALERAFAAFREDADAEGDDALLDVPDEARALTGGDTRAIAAPAAAVEREPGEEDWQDDRELADA